MGMRPQAISYTGDAQVAGDSELRDWWTEIRTRGHPDADPVGWPVQDITTHAELAEVLTTVIWVCTGMHAAGAMPTSPDGGSRVCVLGSE